MLTAASLFRNHNPERDVLPVQAQIYARLHDTAPDIVLRELPGLSGPHDLGAAHDVILGRPSAEPSVSP